MTDLPNYDLPLSKTKDEVLKDFLKNVNEICELAKDKNIKRISTDGENIEIEFFEHRVNRVKEILAANEPEPLVKGEVNAPMRTDVFQDYPIKSSDIDKELFNL